MASHIDKTCLLANCYCLDDYTQLTKNTDNCAKYAECYRVNSFSLPQNMAQTTCGEVGGKLPDIVGSEKEEFINGELSFQ